MSYLNEGVPNNPWLVNYGGTVVEVVEDETRVEIWKKHAKEMESGFNEAIRQRNQRESQVFAWRDVVRKLMERYPELTKDEVNSMFDQFREDNVAKIRALGRPI